MTFEVGDVIRHRKYPHITHTIVEVSDDSYRVENGGRIMFKHEYLWKTDNYIVDSDIEEV